MSQAVANYAEYIESNDEIITYTTKHQPLSYKYSLEWDFTGTQNVGIGKTSILSFPKKLPIEIRVPIQDFMFEFYKKHTMNNNHVSVTLLTTMLTNLLRISDCLKSADWVLLDDNENYRQFKNNLKKRSLALPSIGFVVTTLQRLYDFGRLKRHITLKDLCHLASASSRKQHIALPTVLYMKLLKHCVDEIELYHPYRHNISSTMDQVHSIKEDISCEEVISKNKVEHDKAINKRVARKMSKLENDTTPNLDLQLNGSWLTLLASKCFIVIAMFSGARAGEIISFNKDSYEERHLSNGNVVSIVKGSITKGNGGIAMRATWQTHPIANMALELCYDMMEFARARHRNKIQDSLYKGIITSDHYDKSLADLSSAFVSPIIKEIFEPKSSCILSLAAIRNCVKKCTKELDVIITDDIVDEFNILNPTREGQLSTGKVFPCISPHDFRRCFAVFFKRYGFGNSLALKYQYKHKNLNMSNYYSNNAELMAMSDILIDQDLLELMHEEEINLGIEMYDDIYNKSENLSGSAGEAIQKSKLEITATGQHIFMTHDEIRKIIVNGSGSLVRLPTGGYCTNPSCERICGLSGFIAEKKPCPHQINTDKSAKKQAQLRLRLINKFNALNDGDLMNNHILSGMKQHIIYIENILTKHDISFTPFRVKIRGCYEQQKATN